MKKSEIVELVENLGMDVRTLSYELDEAKKLIVKNSKGLITLSGRVTPAVLMASGEVGASAAGPHDPLGESDAIIGVPVPLLKWATQLIHKACGSGLCETNTYDQKMLLKLKECYE